MQGRFDGVRAGAAVRNGRWHAAAVVAVLVGSVGSMLAGGAGLARPTSAAAAAAATSAAASMAASAAPAAESDFVARINGERAAVGVRPLGIAVDLTDVARGQSDRMATQGTMYHNPDMQSQIGSWQALAENVGTGGSVDSLDAAFYQSSDHRTNLLNDTYTEVGAGVTIDRRGVIWVTMDFRQPTSPPTGGAIGALYDSLGDAGSFLGRPTTGEFDVGPGGRAQDFEGGSAYWSPSSAAHEVHGAIRDGWATYGWERGFLGFPVTNESPTPGGAGRYNHFQGGSVYWTPWTGGQEVHGSIRDRWAGLGWEQGFLGFPVTGELATPDGVGRFNHFEGGSIYWTPWTDSHVVHGAIEAQWAALGWERGPLGYPTSDEYAVPGGRRSTFEHGALTWSQSGGHVEMTAS